MTFLKFLEIYGNPVKFDIFEKKYEKMGCFSKFQKSAKKDIYFQVLYLPNKFKGI